MKITIVSGSSRGLGFHLAKKLQITGKNVAKVERTVTSDKNDMAFQCDLESPHSVISLANTLTKDKSKQYVLICNAASTSTLLDEASGLPKHFICNALSHAYLAKALAKYNQLIGIVSVASTPVKTPIENASMSTFASSVNYFQSKQLGVHLLEHMAAQHYVPYLTFTPGPMKTNLVHNVLQSTLPAFPAWLIKTMARINHIFSNSPELVADRLLKDLNVIEQCKPAVPNSFCQRLVTEIDLIFDC